MRCVLSVVALTAGCYLQHGLEAEDSPPTVTPAPAPAPTPAPFSPEVLASISSVMLGDDCDSGGDSGEWADADSDRSGGGGISDCDGEGCWMPCQQTAMQILFDTRRIDAPLDVEILGVRLLDYESREVHDELFWRNPKHWTESGYVAWEEVLRTLDPERTSYDLTAPAWTRIGDGDYWRTYSMVFELEVDVLIGDEEQTLLSGPINRAPDIDT